MIEFDLYDADVSDSAFLTKNEEINVFRDYKFGSSQESEDAFHRLFLSQYRYMWDLSRKVNKFGSACTIRDVFDIVCMIFVEKLPKYDPSRSRLSTFLHMVVTRDFRSHLIHSLMIRMPYDYTPSMSMRELNDKYDRTGRIGTHSSNQSGRALFESNVLDRRIHSIGDSQPLRVCNIELFDNLSCEFEFDDQFLEYEFVNNVIDRLPVRYKVVHRIAMQGYNRCDAGRLMGFGKEMGRKLYEQMVDMLRMIRFGHEYATTPTGTIRIFDNHASPLAKWVDGYYYKKKQPSTISHIDPIIKKAYKMLCKVGPISMDDLMNRYHTIDNYEDDLREMFSTDHFVHSKFGVMPKV